jgi:hypothetical protein
MEAILHQHQHQRLYMHRRLLECNLLLLLEGRTVRDRPQLCNGSSDLIYQTMSSQLSLPGGLHVQF